MFQSRSRSVVNAVQITVCALACWTGVLTVSTAQDASTLVARLEQRVAERPDVSSSWRLLGKARERSGDREGAFEAFTRAVELDPLSAAAHFDLARLSLAAGDEPEAARHFSESVRLAPESPYAQEARGYLKDLPEPEAEGVVRHAGYDVRRFDRTELVPGLRPPSERLRVDSSKPEDIPPPLSFRFETGALFNTNVALAPTSRELSTGTRESFQLFSFPELEYAALNTTTWRAGPTFQGYFNVNQDEFQSLNVQSYQPGLFVERMILLDSIALLPRAAYSYTHDAFDGGTFADRHALALSTGVVWPNLTESNLYWVTDSTQYADEGSDPAVTSRNGWTTTLGASHRVYVERRWLQSVSAGLEAQHSQTEGINFLYNGLGVYGDAEIPLHARFTLLLNGSLSRRIYPEAQLDPARDEWVLHSGARLRLDITQSWSAAAVFSYDRFESENELFQADRTITGLTTAFQY